MLLDDLEKRKLPNTRWENVFDKAELASAFLACSPADVMPFSESQTLKFLNHKNINFFFRGSF